MPLCRGSPWNHNVQYHDLVLRSIPPHCSRSLDAGCGAGQLTRKLALHCDEVVAIDINPATLSRARATGTPCQNAMDARITYITGDVMTHPFPAASFDFITCVAALHHLPLKPALVRFRDLLKPGGVLAIVGLYRNHTLEDYAWGAAAMPISRILRFLHGDAAVNAPVQDPRETLHEIRDAAQKLLPGALCKRHLFFRYSLYWRSPIARRAQP